MSQKPEYVAQVRITNTITNSNGVVVPKILSIKASKFKDYIMQLRTECDKTYTPNRSGEYGYLPVLSLWDLADSGEEFFYDTFEDLPTETVFNSKGVPVLIIIPESEVSEIGLNKFEHLNKAQRKTVEDHLKNVPQTAFVLPERVSKS